jgi:prophage regulatory protein
MSAIETAVKKPPRRRTPYNPESSIVAPRHLQDAVGLSAVTIWRLRRAGRFPAPLVLSTGRIGWRRSDLELWLASREAKV